ncbi:hypothetical protein C8A05DRAFT_32929 [Staphylotrichum tortipilum]|uniref:Protein transport protein sec73 n=1 Tax=Staphylotrichum tortipilum TaxID=2831512 RepID=A0AAN6RTY7_9PEZI|nr:hypothetical protein C8A05DRAFT_32929 [Staphylotrichum longicolle]
MPFLRRRGHVASETDMRRHSHFESLAAPLPKQPPFHSGSAAELHGLTSVAEDSAAPRDSISVASSRAVPSIIEPFDGPAPLPITSTDYSQKHRRFSMLRFRNASDSQLAAKAKLHAAAEQPPPVPCPPEIIMTAPTFNTIGPKRKTSRMGFTGLLRRSGEHLRTDEIDDVDGRPAGHEPIRRVPGHSVSFDETERPPPSHVHLPPPYGDDHSSALALPPTRLSESSRSDASSGDRVYGSTTTTTHTVHTTTTFFRLPRRKPKQPEPLFPISHLQPKGKTPAGAAANPNASSTSFVTSTAPGSPDRSTATASRLSQYTPTPSRTPSRNGVTTPPPQNQAVVTLLARPSLSSPATALFRPSSQSGQSSPTRSYINRRGRSSTLSSLGRNSPRESVDDHLAPPTSRTSISTGRKSFSDLFGLGRLRQNPDMLPRQGTLTPGTAGSNTSKNNSLQLPRGSVSLPERRDDDTPAKYLERLLEVVSRSVVAAALSKNTDPFSLSVLRSYMRGFKFFGDPMDMALRKLLMEAELPKETQQIDRFLQAFANRYHECNPGIYSTPDQAYFIAFSLLILHTDVFNKNNKHKMQKTDYLKNTRGEGISEDILGVFYDNITYTPFIHVEDDLDINGERILTQKARKKSIFPHPAPDPAKKVAKEPVDPYTLIIDNRLDLLRPGLKDVMQLDDPYNYLGTAKSLSMKELQRTFFKTGVLQIVSARSRPDAFMTEKTATNPEEAHPGIVDIKITKVGLLWRKDAKKKKTRSPWQEWGAILTGAQLYFFRNTTWIKQLMHQEKDHLKKGHDGDPCIFKPPLEQFKPDGLMSTDGAVALLDSSYNKHKNAFVYVRHGGFEEVLLAEDDDDMNDWLAKLNYAAAFRTSGVRMRGVIGGNYDGQSRRAIRGSSSGNVQVIQTASGEVTVTRSRIDHKMAQDILAARRDFMGQKIADADEKLKEAEATLESHLRNARHLQIQAPISPKTREQMLLAAARMAAQLKWTRMEIWKLKCHRDILELDLEEERQLLGLPPDDVGTDAAEKSIARSTSTAQPKSPQAPAQLSLTRSSTITVMSDGDASSVTEVFQTPPTSATVSREDSWNSPGTAFENGVHRKASVSTAAGSDAPVPATPPPANEAGPSTSPEKPEFEQPDDVDAGERDLLEQAGLLEPEMSRTSDHKSANGGAEGEETTTERRDRASSGTPGERSERSKIRRSLQRTLRESAGHISHHRHRRAKDSTSNATLSDDGKRDGADVLPRGTGSFVVHGKKASVVTFGNELHMQSLTAEDRIRQRLQRDDSTSVRSGAPAESTDFQSILTAQSISDREHRDSAASASTATARSFRELHRKYSSAQAANRTAGGGSLALPYDEDSDAAISFSDGRRTPLPPIEGEEELEGGAQGEELLDEALRNGRLDHLEAVEYLEMSPPPSREGRNTVFFTPEPSSPIVEAPAKAETDEAEGLAEGAGDQFASPPLQSVSA